MISRLKKLLSLTSLKDDIVDSNLRKELALLIVRGNNRYIIYLAFSMFLIFVFSGSGDGLSLFGVNIKPISETAVALLSSTSGYLLKGWQDEKQIILSYYFFNKTGDEEIKTKEITEDSYDLHKNPLTSNGNTFKQNS